MTKHTIVIWDKFIRVFHWLIAASFFINYFFTESSGDVHEYLGYGVLILLMLRIVWGFIGPDNARFSSFLPSVKSVTHHLKLLRKRQFEDHKGHNPVGGLMVFLLLTGLLIISLSGWMLEWEMFWGEEWLENIHEIAADIILIAVFVHVSAILFLNKWLKTNLIKTMMTGKRDIQP